MLGELALSLLPLMISQRLMVSIRWNNSRSMKTAVQDQDAEQSNKQYSGHSAVRRYRQNRYYAADMIYDVQQGFEIPAMVDPFDITVSDI